jgi:hypothetical protein
MTTRKQFLDKVKELGCTFEEDPNTETAPGFFNCITVDAPVGYKFVANHGHCIIEQFSHATFHFKSDCYKELIESMNYGLMPCEDPECDICHPDAS